MTTTDAGGAGANPFVGPRPFKIGERLFGRRREIGELSDLLYAERIVLLHSPSGAGKSSLIAAGLVPRLRERFEVLPIIRVNQAPPPLPFAAERAVSRYAWSVLVSLEAERRTLPPAALLQTTLADYLARRPRPDGVPRRTLLLFDQFEELLTVDPLAIAEKERFCAELAAVLDDDTNWALFAVREDYVGPLERYRDRLPSRLRNTFALRLLGRLGGYPDVERDDLAQALAYAAWLATASVQQYTTRSARQRTSRARPRSPGRAARAAALRRSDAPSDASALTFCLPPQTGARASLAPTSTADLSPRVPKGICRAKRDARPGKIPSPGAAETISLNTKTEIGLGQPWERKVRKR